MFKSQQPFCWAVLLCLMCGPALLLGQPPALPDLNAPSEPYLEADDIRGSLTKVAVLNDTGSTIAAGEPLVIEFEYTTDAPGVFAVGADVDTEGGRVDYVILQPYLLSARRGRGSVYLNYSPPRTGPDLLVKRVDVYLFPAKGGFGRRDATSLAGPFTFEGTELFTRETKNRIVALEREVRELREAVAELQLQAGL